jgi:hypothetical protein
VGVRETWGGRAWVMDSESCIGIGSSLAAHGSSATRARGGAETNRDSYHQAERPGGTVCDPTSRADPVAKVQA